MYWDERVRKAVPGGSFITDAQSQRAVEWFYREHFGFSKAPPQTDAEVVRNMALALITAASGDRILSPTERRWFSVTFPPRVTRCR